MYDLFIRLKSVSRNTIYAMLHRVVSMWMWMEMWACVCVYTLYTHIAIAMCIYTWTHLTLAVVLSLCRLYIYRFPMYSLCTCNAFNSCCSFFKFCLLLLFHFILFSNTLHAFHDLSSCVCEPRWASLWIILSFSLNFEFTNAANDRIHSLHLCLVEQIIIWPQQA